MIYKLNNKRMSSGFTLIELIIVIAIIGILATLAVPAFNNATRTSKVASARALAATLNTGVVQSYIESTMTGTGAYPVTGDGTGANDDGNAMKAQFVDADIAANWTFSYQDDGAFRHAIWALNSDDDILVVYSLDSEGLSPTNKRYNVYFSVPDSPYTSVGSNDLTQNQLRAVTAPSTGRDGDGARNVLPAG